ncbi:MAG: ATP-binding protein [Candidatus Dormibacteria bacterium]|jgi:signal transduction histidine kinase/CheY-like chemotaxis protein
MAPRRSDGDDQVAILRTQAQRLVRANLALLRQVRPASVLQWMAHDIRTVVGASHAAVLLLDGPGGSPGTFVHSGLARNVAGAIPAERPAAHGLLRDAMGAGRSMRVADIRTPGGGGTLPAGHPSVASFVSAPLIRHREVIGLVYAANKRGAAEFTLEDERFVARMAAELGRTPLLTGAATPELVDRIAVTSQALRKEMEATRSFLSSLSHELRGSIAGILVSAELISDPAYESLEEEQVRTVGRRIHSVAGNLLALVDNLLDLGRLEAGRLDVRLQPVDLSPLLDDVSAVIAPLADPAGVSVEWPPTAGLPRVLADPIRVRQVLVNLLTNAVKFTPAGGRAWLEVEADPESVRLTVGDTGRGIPPTETERIFEPFERGEGVQGQGVGLGLAICRRIVDLHGSRLEVSSQPGAGSRFWFRLRRSREPLPPRLLRPAGGQTAVAGRDGRAASILVVEDDAASRQSISDVLSAAGYRVRAVATRGAALEAIGSTAPDAVVLDVQLPDGSGLEIIESLRAAVDRPLAVLVLSADRIGDTAERAMAAGCDRFGLKPIAARELLGLIAGAVQDRRADPPAATR